VIAFFNLLIFFFQPEGEADCSEVQQ